MRIVKIVLAVACMAFVHLLQAENSPFKFEGILGAPVEQINNMNHHARSFMPYNPIIVEIGAYEGCGTLDLAHTYPYGKIFAFEPNPRAYSVLCKNVRPFRNVTPINLAVNNSQDTCELYLGAENSDIQASLLPLKSSSKRGQIKVPCVVLDDWCKQHEIDHIDFLRLDAGGLEYQILKSSPEMLKKVSVIVTKTYFHKLRKTSVPYFFLKYFLIRNGFEPLSHWYEDGQEGEATFVRSCMYDSIFR